MSAAELRRAAETLRVRAAGSINCNGPWRVDKAFPYDISEHVEGDEDSPYHVGTAYAAEAATYIATMHPGVGLALADWLDDEAKAVGYHEGRAIPFAVTIARLINGGA